MLLICKSLEHYKILFPAASSSKTALEEIWNIFNYFLYWNLSLENEWEILKI